MGIEEGDAVMAVQVSDGNSEVFIGTADGMSIRFPEGDVRSMGPHRVWCAGHHAREGDTVVAMEVLRPGGTILSVTEQGYGQKETELDVVPGSSRAAASASSISRRLSATERWSDSAGHETMR